MNTRFDHFIMMLRKHFDKISRIIEFSENDCTSYDIMSFEFSFQNCLKFNWETFNSRKIKLAFHSLDSSNEQNYGAKIKIKCHEPIIRKDYTLDGEKCAYWNNVDSFGVKFVPNFDFSRDMKLFPGYELALTGVYENFYDPLQFTDESGSRQNNHLA